MYGPGMANTPAGHGIEEFCKGQERSRVTGSAAADRLRRVRVVVRAPHGVEQTNTVCLRCFMNPYARWRRKKR